jgi:hypothetical protein
MIRRRAGAVAFLVPPEEERDAQRHAGSMRIIAVRTLDDALAALQQVGGAPTASAVCVPVCPL